MSVYKTMQRESVLYFLKTSINRAFTVKEIAKGIKSDDTFHCCPSESTIYRIMSDLVKSGAVQRKINDKREYQYKLISENVLKISVRCKVCGQVNTVDEKVCSEIIDTLKNNGYNEPHEDIEVIGICTTCK